MTTPTLPHEHYYIGTEIILQATFRDRAEVLADPTDVSLRVKTPDGQTETITANATSEIGVWEGFYTIQQKGKHWYRFAGTGFVTAASEKAFQGLEQHVPDEE